ncbi:hypothetical protein [uncultured Rhodospira sp.]|uniref:hypothetical protein n=1 Tax=uncultured Rhodospira sp. TaxID=1936189 RepID=UPI002636DF9F|nr:hypothetical protein [uncultured Rhodospira sp.]
MTVMPPVLATLETTRHSIDWPGGVLVSTDCVYPDMSKVMVLVSGTREVMVDDNGGAVETLTQHLRQTRDWARFLASHAKRYGLVAKGRTIGLEKPVPLDRLSSAIVYVANASKEAADEGLRTLKVERSRKFKDTFNSFIRETYSKNERTHDYSVAGASNKLHHFSVLLHRSGEEKVLVDPITQDPNGLNGRVVAHLDVQNAPNASFIHRVYYDDEAEDWQASNLALARMAGQVIAFSRAQAQVLPH